MNDRPSGIGWIALALGTLLLGGCSYWSGGSRLSGEALAPCTGSGSMFASLLPLTIPQNQEDYDRMRRDGRAPMSIQQAAQLYHQTVGGVIDAHMELHTNKASVCQETPANAGASGPLSALAASLPPWKSETRKNALMEREMHGVLLEYLRIYQCSLLEYKDAAYEPAISWWYTQQNLTVVSDEYVDSISRENALTAAGEIQRLVDREAGIARTALQRTLAFVGGVDRLHAGDVDFECVRRASMDLRNVMGLLSEALSCSAKALDARGSLREPKSPDEE
jgi:hypothetical protein